MLTKNSFSTLGSLLSQAPSLPLMSLVVIALTLLNALFNSLASSIGFGYPFSTFLFKPWDVFGDLFKVAASYPGPPLHVSATLAPLFEPHTAAESGGISNLNAPPLVSLMYLSVRHALGVIHPIGVLGIFVVAWIAPLCLLVLRQHRSRLISMTLVCALLISYPTLFAVTRGNLGAGFAAAALIAAIAFTYEKKAPLAVALLIAIAVNIRPNAVIFLLLPFLASAPRDAIRYAACCLMFSAGIALASFLTVQSLYPAYTLTTFGHGVGLYYAHYVMGDKGLAYGSSFFGLAKALVAFLDCSCDLEVINKVVAFFWGAVLLVAAVLLKQNRIGRRPFIFVLCAVYALASSVFADYHLLLFFGIFLIYSDSGHVPWTNLRAADKTALICAALMLAPKNYVFFDGWVSVQVLVNPIILATGVLLLIIMSYGEHRSAPSKRT